METAVPAIDSRIMIAGMRVPSAWLTVPFLALAGCSGSSDGAGMEPDPTTSEAPPETAPVSGDGLSFGTIEGIVRLAPGTTLPRYEANPMVSAGASSPMPPECPPPGDGDAQPVQVGSSGGLTNLVIVATGDAEHWPSGSGPETRTVRIERCRLEPRTLVAQRGDTIHLETELTFPFFPDLGTGFTRALLPTDPLDLVLDQGGVRTIECSFANACGRTDVVTLYHPVFAVSDVEGRFRMTNVPAGQDVRVTAWHPLFQEVGAQARVEAGGTTHLELVIQPVPPPAPPSTVPETPRDPLEGDIPE